MPPMAVRCVTPAIIAPPVKPNHDSGSVPSDPPRDRAGWKKAGETAIFWVHTSFFHFNFSPSPQFSPLLSSPMAPLNSFRLIALASVAAVAYFALVQQQGQQRVARGMFT